MNEDTLKRIEFFFSAVVDPAYVVDTDGLIIKANGVALRTFSDLEKGMGIDNLAQAFSWTDGEDCFEKCISQRETTFHFVKDDRGRCLFEISIIPLCISKDEPEAVMIIVNNMVGEILVDERNRILDQVFNCIAEAVITVDLKGRITGVNRSAVNLLGVSEGDIKFKPVVEVLQFKENHEETSFLNACSKKEQREMLASLVLPSGKEMTSLISISCLSQSEDYVTGFAIIVKDSSKQLQIDQRLMQMEKLNSLGSLVAGFAHELNNPLTSVLGFSQLLLASSANDSSMYEELDLVYKHAVRCKNIVDNLLNFARKRAPEKKMMDVNSIVEATIDLLNYQISRNQIKIQMELNENLPFVFVDQYQVQQVLVNLIENARFELGKNEEQGTICISTTENEEYVQIKVSDSGSGIPELLKHRIFEPFFTTKPPDLGTGLGLSLSNKIVVEHNGTLTVEDSTEGGAEFLIQLPIEVENIKEYDAAADPVCFIPKKDKKILVVDNEEGVFDLVYSIFSPQGVSVDAASCENDALNKLQDTEFDLLLLNFNLPDGDGSRLEEAVKSNWGKYKDRVLFMTDESVGDSATEGGVNFHHDYQILNKPFSVHLLSSSVWNLLELE